MREDASRETGSGAVGLLTAREVAARLQLDHHTVRKMIRAGVLPCVWIGTTGRMLRVRPEDLEAYITQQAVLARTEPLTTVPMAARQMGMNPLLLRQAHERGELHFYVIGSWPRVRMSEVHAWLQQSRHQQPMHAAAESEPDASPAER